MATKKVEELTIAEKVYYDSLDAPDKRLFLKGKSINYNRRMEAVLKKVPKGFFDGYYNPTKVLATDCTLKMIVSKRSDGKTFGLASIILLAWQYFDYPSALVRRLAESLKASSIMHFFDKPFKNPNMPNPKGYDGVSYRSGAFRGYWIRDKKKVYDNPFCYTYALSQGETAKGTRDIPELFMELFDEFLSHDMYLRNEVLDYQNSQSSLARLCPYVNFVLLGNPVSWDSPYFKEFHMGKVEKLERGIHFYRDEFNDFSIAMHLCDEEIDGAKALNWINKRFFPSQSNSLRAIVHGDWEMNQYPHVVWNNDYDKLLLDHIFFEDDNRLVALELYEHRADRYKEEYKITPYSRNFRYVLLHPAEKYDFNKGARVYTLMPQNNLEKGKLPNYTREPDKLLDIIEQYDWYFSDNETGEIVRNFVRNFTNRKYFD